jgi:hypothetical protein
VPTELEAEREVLASFVLKKVVEFVGHVQFEGDGIGGFGGLAFYFKLKKIHVAVGSFLLLKSRFVKKAGKSTAGKQAVI